VVEMLCCIRWMVLQTSCPISGDAQMSVPRKGHIWWGVTTLRVLHIPSAV